MDIHSVRQELRTKSIYEIPLRVTYYARVSSESDEKLNSLGNQIKYYEDLIRRNGAWTFVPGYIDEGLSGISTKRRENFNRMIDDAARDKFDLVITKEISRFARNTLDSIRYTRELLADGVGRVLPERQHQHPRRGQRASALYHVLDSAGRAAQALEPRKIRPSAGDKAERRARQQPYLWLQKGQQAARYRRGAGADGARAI